MEVIRGQAQKMAVALPSVATESVQYQLRLGDSVTPLNPVIGSSIRIEYLGDIHCIHCGRKSNKSFSQGFCFPCFKTLAQCDSCIMSPEKCHHHLGTCREPEWGETHCMVDHVVYLANSSGVKVGITRGTQIPTRWIDQGATQAMPFFRVATRRQSGLLEDVFRQFVADKTSWQAMLKGEAEVVNLVAIAEDLLDKCADSISDLQKQFGLHAIQHQHAAEQISLHYPVVEYPSKVKSFNLDKSPVAEGTLLGIKGQYLILDTGVINLRKYTGYNLQFSY